MLRLLGPVVSVDAQMDFVDLQEGPTDAAFTTTLRHRLGAHSHLSASKLNHLTSRELRAYGAKGSYVSHATDVQTQAIFAGKRPADDPDWLREPAAAWGTLRTAAGTEVISAELGRYQKTLRGFRKCRSHRLPTPCIRKGRRRDTRCHRCCKTQRNRGKVDRNLYICAVETPNLKLEAR